MSTTDVTPSPELKTCKSGRHNYTGRRCIECSREKSVLWAIANKERCAANAKAWANSNPEKVKAKSKKYYDENSDKCIAASRKYQSENIEKIRASAASWRANNPEKVSVNRLAWAASNKGKVFEINRKQRLKNPKALRDKKAEYRNANKEKIASAGRIYREENKDAIRLLKANRRAKKREAGGSLSTGLVDRLMVLQKGRCACCGDRLGGSYHLDHIIPIALGGENTDGNIQLLKARCNLQKKAKHPVDFMQERGFLL